MKEFLESCRRGDTEAVGLLVRRYRSSALDLASAILEDEHLAEDAVQEAFLTALRRLGDLREPEAFAGWFRQVVRTECHRLLRRRKEVLVEHIRDSAAPTLSPAEEVQQQERRRIVRDTLASLPPLNREAAELFYLKHYELAAIGQRLGIPVGTVKRRLYDTRQQMRAQLAGVLDTLEAPSRSDGVGRKDTFA